MLNPTAQGDWGGEDKAREDSPQCVFKTWRGGGLLIWVPAATFLDTGGKSLDISKDLTDSTQKV